MALIQQRPHDKHYISLIPYDKGVLTRVLLCCSLHYNSESDFALKFTTIDESNVCEL